ncbi:MAG: flagellar protein FlaG [Bacillota bacterium]|nr:flagellar protein FlaG [Bacillota bacterium]
MMRVEGVNLLVRANEDLQENNLQKVVENEGKKEITEEEVIQAIEKANQKIEFYNTYLEFSIHEKTRQIVVRVYREEELIREIPPEKVLDMVAQMMEWAGLLVDETV